MAAVERSISNSGKLLLVYDYGEIVGVEGSEVVSENGLGRQKMFSNDKPNAARVTRQSYKYRMCSSLSCSGIYMYLRRLTDTDCSNPSVSRRTKPQPPKHDPHSMLIL